MLPGGTRRICMILAHVSWDGDLYWVNPPQPLGTAGEELLDDLDHDVS